MKKQLTVGNWQLAKTFLLILGCMLSVHTFSQQRNHPSFDSANKAYQREEFEKAILLYEAEAGRTESAELYYNLGNAYFKYGNVSKAILNYERAKKLAPDDEDLKFNLNLANQKITDRIDSAPTLLISDWWSEFCNNLSVDSWAWLTVFILVFALLFFGLFIVSRSMLLKRIGFFTFFISVIIFAASFLITSRQYHLAEKHDTAIIMSESVSVKSAPAEKAKQLFMLHAGTKIEIVSILDDWYEISLPNKTKGWMKKADLEAI